MTDLGVLLARPSPDSLVDDAAALDALGVDAIWLTDHLYWHEPTVDVIGALALVAHATERCRLGPGVLQLPLRSAAAVAKSMAFLDRLAPGRVVVGVGVGEHRGEYEAAHRGPAYGRRGRVLDRDIARLREAWAGGEDGYALLPARPLPIWVGGRSGASLRRAATLGDGWFPHLCTPDWYAAHRARLDGALAEHGRDPAEVRRGVLVAAAVEGVEPGLDPAAWLGSLYRLDPGRFGHVLVHGSAARILEAIAAYEQAGAEHVALMIAGDRPVDHVAALLTA